MEEQNLLAKQLLNDIIFYNYGTYNYEILKLPLKNDVITYYIPLMPFLHREFWTEECLLIFYQIENSSDYEIEELRNKKYHINEDYFEQKRLYLIPIENITEENIYQEFKKLVENTSMLDNFPLPEYYEVNII